MTRKPGRHFLQIPGPTNIPDPILRAMDMPVIDHRSSDFAALSLRIFDRIKQIFKCTGPVVIYPASGSGAWTAAMVNTLSPGDHVLMYETGEFARLWRNVAEGLGLVPEFIESDWRRGVEPEAIEKRLAADSEHKIKAVCVVHNETATGCRSRLNEVRAAIDRTGHPALLMVDTVSSLGSTDFRHDDWGVDVTVSGSQKGLMLPPGLAFNAISEKALEAAKSATLAKTYWDWSAMLAVNQNGFFPYTPAVNLLYGLDAAIDMLLDEGLDNVFARHERFAEATRRAVSAWGLDILCVEPRDYSNTVTSVLVPAGHDADRLRAVILDKFNMALGAGLGKVAGKVFRIGHIGDLNELTLMGALAGVEMGLELAGIPHQKGGVQAAMDYLAGGTEAQVPSSVAAG